jgi:hypothetical protein
MSRYRIYMEVNRSNDALLCIIKPHTRGVSSVNGSNLVSKVSARTYHCYQLLCVITYHSRGLQIDDTRTTACKDSSTSSVTLLPFCFEPPPVPPPPPPPFCFGPIAIIPALVPFVTLLLCSWCFEDRAKRNRKKNTSRKATGQLDYYGTIFPSIFP